MIRCPHCRSTLIERDPEGQLVCFACTRPLDPSAQPRVLTKAEARKAHAEQIRSQRGWAVRKLGGG